MAYPSGIDPKATFPHLQHHGHFNGRTESGTLIREPQFRNAKRIGVAQTFLADLPKRS